MPKPLFKKHREKWIALSRKYEMQSNERMLEGFILKQLLIVLSLSYMIYGLFRKFDPSLIIGAFEKSAHGSLFFEFSRANRKLFPCKVVNIQHGLIAEPAMLDRCKFDRFFVWDKATYNVIKSSGYHPLRTVKVIGNKVWDNLRASVHCPKISSDREELKRWKDRSRLILLCTQPLGAEKQNAIIKPLLTYINDKDIKLLVRLHPAQKYHEMAYLLDALSDEFNDQIKTISSHEMELSDCLYVADLVCSSFSTVLIDAKFAGRQSLSIMPDFEPNSKFYIYLKEYEIPVAINDSECHDLLSKLLFEHESTLLPINDYISYFSFEFIHQLNKLFFK